MKNFYLLPLVLLVILGCKFFAGSNSNVSENVNRLPATPSVSSSGLTFSPDKLPPAEVGKPYKVEIEVHGQRTPVGGTSIPAGSLPEGLVFAEQLRAKTIGEVSGTPKKAGKFKVKIAVWCFGTQVSGQTGDIEYELEVKESAGKSK
jgi:hypothetical protein